MFRNEVNCHYNVLSNYVNSKRSNKYSYCDRDISVQQITPLKRRFNQSEMRNNNNNS